MDGASRKQKFDGQEKVLRELRKNDVSDEIVMEVPELPKETTSVLIYGSRARGDHTPDSDLDMLILTPSGGRNLKNDKVSVAIYSSEELSNARGTLFGHHLKRDSKIMYDPSNQLAKIVKGLGEVDAERVFARSRRLAKVLTCPDQDLPRYTKGLYREARYLLRSCLYAKSIAEGQPSFSVRELAVRYDCPKYAEILKANPQCPDSEEDYKLCRDLLFELLEDHEKNEHGSLEALIVNEWAENSDLMSVALMALGDIDELDDYAEVKAVFL